MEDQAKNEGNKVKTNKIGLKIANKRDCKIE